MNMNSTSLSYPGPFLAAAVVAAIALGLSLAAGGQSSRCLARAQQMSQGYRAQRFFVIS